MVFYEVDTTGDFASVWSSVAQQKREDEERKQTELFLRILDELEQKTQVKGQAKGQVKGLQPPKEYLRVSITDDGLPEKNALASRKERQARDDKVKRVHTIKDLPQDDFFFGTPLIEEEEEEPALSIEPGRRLKDGQVSYHARLSSALREFLLDESGSVKLDIVLLVFMFVFLMGVYLGRRREKVVYYMPPPMGTPPKVL